MSANYEEKRILWNDKEQIIPRGSFITGRKRLAEDTKQAETTIYRNLKILSNLGMISLKTNNRFTLIEVVNYCTYQVSDLESGQQLNSGFTNVNQFINGTTVKVDNKKGGINTDSDELYEKNKLGSEQQMDNKRTTDGQQVDTTKKLKNIKNNKELKHICESSDSYTPEFEEFYKTYPRNKDKGRAFKAWKARIKEKIPAEVLITAARHYAAECKLKHTPEEYIKYPATFLSKEARSWEDYLTPQRGSKPLTYEAVVTEEERLENERIIQKYANLGGDAVVSETAQ